MAEVCGGRGATEVRLVAERKDPSGGRAMSECDRPKSLARPSFRKDCGEVPSRSRKPCMSGVDCERGNPENPGDLVEKREPALRWLNPGLPIWVKPGPRPKPPAREPKEPILCAEQGTPQTTRTTAKTSQIRGGISHLHLPTNSAKQSVAQKGRAIATEMSNSGHKLFVMADIDSEADLMPESLLPGAFRNSPKSTKAVPYSLC